MLYLGCCSSPRSAAERCIQHSHKHPWWRASQLLFTKLSVLDVCRSPGYVTELAYFSNDFVSDWVVKSDQKWSRMYPAGIDLFKVNNRNTRTRCEICSKLTIDCWLLAYFTRCSSVSIVNFDHVITGLVKRLYHG